LYNEKIHPSTVLFSNVFNFVSSRKNPSTQGTDGRGWIFSASAKSKPEGLLKKKSVNRKLT